MLASSSSSSSPMLTFDVVMDSVVEVFWFQ